MVQSEWVMTGTVKETMFSWAFRRRSHGREDAEAWDVAPLALAWNVWRERNRELLKE